MTQFFGKTTIEDLVREKIISRQIVKEISEFGISDNQRWHVLYFLAMELENFEDSREIAEIIKAKKPELFIATE